MYTVGDVQLVNINNNNDNHRALSSWAHTSAETNAAT